MTYEEHITLMHELNHEYYENYESTLLAQQQIEKKKAYLGCHRDKPIKKVYL